MSDKFQTQEIKQDLQVWKEELILILTATKKGRYTILYVFFLFVYCSDTKEIV